uniref:Lipid scramblase CLPTM1L n=1 Tax=Cacopsylla melanoneura TaxID=428564 RepID=A0A8D9DP68_9HEMI
MGILSYISLSKIVISLGLGFMFHSMWSIYKLSVPPECPFEKTCLKSSLLRNPKLELILFSSVREQPSARNVDLILEKKNYDYNQAFEETIKLNVPFMTRNNGTLYLHMFIIAQKPGHWDWDSLARHNNDQEIKVYRKIPFSKYAVPVDRRFNLLSDEQGSRSNKKPVTHIKTLIEFNMLTEVEKFPRLEIPFELYNFFRITSRNEFLPIVTYNLLNDRHTFLKEIDKSTDEVGVNFKYAPISYGKLRLMLHVEASFKNIQQMGFSDKEIDDVKSMFADTHLYVFLTTIVVSFVHLLFDFLAFKNDVSFWKNRTNTVGISIRSVMWRTFSQIVVFLYLLDEKTSYLVLIPNGISGVIEVWKLLKIFKFDSRSWRFTRKTQSVQESRTSAYDLEAMRYLSYVLYPLCMATAVYSFVYSEHKSLYSWLLRSLVNSVYAFGFVFMLPQLFINYKLKSVAHLPWRTFMYKAFNTFIDDVFAFLITMPTMHRLACFRDDIIFLIYLYQRWLYPVDKRRLDENSDMSAESNEQIPPLDKKSEQEKKKKK